MNFIPNLSGFFSCLFLNLGLVRLAERLDPIEAGAKSDSLPAETCIPCNPCGYFAR